QNLSYHRMARRLLRRARATHERISQSTSVHHFRRAHTFAIRDRRLSGEQGGVSLATSLLSDQTGPFYRAYAVLPFYLRALRGHLFSIVFLQKRIRYAGYRNGRMAYEGSRGSDNTHFRI